MKALRHVVPVLTRGLVILLAAGLAPSEVDAQMITAGPVPFGIEININDESYAIHGNTAQALLDQMQMLGPGGEWASFPYSFQWHYQPRVVLTAGGLHSGRCRGEEFEMRFTVEAIYPRWNRPDDAPDELIAAWESFEELLLAHWEERRRYVIDFAQEAGLRVRRLEESCSSLRERADGLVRDLSDQAIEAEREAIAQGAHVRLRWPPEGYDELLPGRAPAPLPPPGPAPAPRPAAGGFARAAASDVSPMGMTGVVAGLQRAGEVEYLEAFGFADQEEQEPLTADAVFRFPAFTEVAVSALAAALDREGLVDLQAPLSSYLPDLDDRLGAVSLDHLLSHRSGLDDASARDSVWSVNLDDLDDRAVFTDPGAVFSFSSYDYPLAVRALGRSIGGDVLAEASRRVFEPLGMENTSLRDAGGGLPVLLTTAPDLLRFGSAWVDGEVGVAPSLSTGRYSAALLEGGDRMFEGGVWRDLVGGQPRVSLMCTAGSAGDAAGLQIFPDAGVVFVFWSRAQSSSYNWPEVAARFLLEALGSDLGVGSGIFEPRRVRGDAELQRLPRPCNEPAWNTVWTSDPGPLTRTEAWNGRYANGDRVLELRKREGVVWLTDGTDWGLAVTHLTGDTYFTTMGGRPLYPFRLVRDDAGRRYVVVGDRAHIHDDDRPGG